MVLAGGLAMVEAAQTEAAPAAIWVIIVVVLLCLAFWLTAVMVADRRQATLSRRQRMPDVPGPALGGSQAARTGQAAGTGQAEQTGQAAAGAVPRARRAPDTQAGPVPQARGRGAQRADGTPTEAPTEAP